MSSLTPPPSRPIRGVRATFAGLVDGFVAWFCGTFYNELVALQANLNSIAAGGAYAIPYTWTTQSGVGGSGGYSATASAAVSQDTSTVLYLDLVAGNSASVVTRLTNLLVTGATSANKGYVRIQKIGDPSRELLFSVSNMGNGGTYLGLTVQCVGSSSANPFAPGDAVMLFFQRTGDKGDPGSSQAVKFSDRKASGTAGGTPVANDATAVRILNTTDYNTIPSGVSLSGNQFTLPAGTYDFFGRAPAYSVGAHKATLYNVTDGQIALVGSSAYSNTSTAQTDSVFSGRLTLASAKTFAVRHYVASAGSGSYGTATAVAGQVEAYTEVTVIKAI